MSIGEKSAQKGVTIILSKFFFFSNIFFLKNLWKILRIFLHFLLTGILQGSQDLSSLSRIKQGIEFYTLYISISRYTINGSVADTDPFYFGGSGSAS